MICAPSNRFMCEQRTVLRLGRATGGPGIIHASDQVCLNCKLQMYFDSSAFNVAGDLSKAP